LKTFNIIIEHWFANKHDKTNEYKRVNEINRFIFFLELTNTVTSIFVSF